MSDKLASEDVLYTTENQRRCLISGGMCQWDGGGGTTVNPVSSAEEVGSPGTGPVSHPGGNPDFVTYKFWHLKLGLLEPPFSHL